MGLRRLFSGLKDSKLQEIVFDDQITTGIAESRYKVDGGIDPELAGRVSQLREEATVARAVGRERKLGGGPDSHGDLGIAFNPSPKRENSLFGRVLRRKRGVEG